jgi:hypothetical protein
MECACGKLIRGQTHEKLVETARAHIRRDHPELGQPPSAADLIAMAVDDPVNTVDRDHAAADPRTDRKALCPSSRSTKADGPPSRATGGGSRVSVASTRCSAPALKHMTLPPAPMRKLALAAA